MYSLDSGEFTTKFGNKKYLQWINLRYLFTEKWNCLPNMLEDNVIYCIQNQLNLKCYIGQAKNFYNRFVYKSSIYLSHIQGYADTCKNGTNSILYRSLNKYKSRNFKVYILEELNSVDDLNDFEIKWIKELHTCTLDPECWGYNMNFGGTDRSQMMSESARQKARAKLMEMYDGDPIGQLHTPTAIQHNLESRKRLYNGDICGMMHTKDAQLKANQSKLINGIKHRINLLKYHNLEITPLNYYIYVPIDIVGHCLSGIQLSHIDKVCTRLYDDPPIYLNNDWDPSWTELFNWFDNENNYNSLSNLQIIQLNSPDQ